MIRNQATDLLRHEHLVTTMPKAKELRPFVERLITIAKRGPKDLAARRLVISKLGGNRRGFDWLYLSKNPGDEEKIRQIYIDNLTNDTVGMGVHKRGDAIYFHYPTMIFVGTKPNEESL